MAIKLFRDTTKQLRSSVKQFVAKELDQDIGDMKADVLIDYVLKEIGPSVYNRAIADAQAFFQNRLADLEGVCYEPEFTYWAPGDDRSGRGSRATKAPRRMLAPSRSEPDSVTPPQPRQGRRRLRTIARPVFLWAGIDAIAVLRARSPRPRVVTSPLPPPPTVACQRALPTRLPRAERR